MMSLQEVTYIFGIIRPSFSKIPVLRPIPPKISENASCGSREKPRKVAFSGLFLTYFHKFSNLTYCKSKRRKIFEYFLWEVLRCKGKGVFLQSRFAHLTNGARGRGCASAAGEARDKTGNVL